MQMICKLCGGEINRRPNEALFDYRCRKYCSRSCANSAANRAKPKRKRKRFSCRNCGGETEQYGRAYCERCFQERYDNYDLQIKGEVTDPVIRSRSRSVLAGEPMQCRVCGYDKHVQACHKRAVSDFPETATLREINAPDNLVWLCPNHHWELDHQSLSIDGLRILGMA